MWGPTKIIFVNNFIQVIDGSLHFACNIPIGPSHIYKLHPTLISFIHHVSQKKDYSRQYKHSRNFFSYNMQFQFNSSAKDKEPAHNLVSWAPKCFRLWLQCHVEHLALGRWRRINTEISLSHVSPNLMHKPPALESQRILI